MAFDVARIRGIFPALGDGWIHLDAPAGMQVPEQVATAVYTALRPRRSTAAELEDWAGQLDEWDAPLTAAFVREALAVYRERGLLAG
jgi:propanediol dehydratase small subunit